MNKHPLDNAWKDWLKESLSRGCSTEEILGVLLNHDFEIDSIRENMGTHFPAGSGLLSDKEPAQIVDHAAIASTRITRPDQPFRAWKLMTDKVQLYTIDNFLND